MRENSKAAECVSSCNTSSPLVFVHLRLLRFRGPFAPLHLACTFAPGMLSQIVLLQMLTGGTGYSAYCCADFDSHVHHVG